jgi:hypothetical protein
MRGVLHERLLTTTQAQARLEAEVAARTAELRRQSSELELALQELREAKEALLSAEKMASIGRLIAGIAHEINNPINAVVNTANPLRDALVLLQASLPAAGSAPPAKAEEPQLGELAGMLRVLQRGTQRTREIVKALHNYSQGGGEARVAIDVHRVLDEALELVQHPEKSRVAIVRSYRATHPVHGLAGELQQVFINLFSNALHALALRKDDGAPLELRISTEEDPEGRELRVSVSDNGVGIPPDALPRIFDPFFTTKDATEGSGLGLSIVHGIVARHGGQIHVDSAKGSGASFTVTLPWWQEAATNAATA